MSKADIIRAIKAVYKFDPDFIENVVNEEWDKKSIDN